MTRLEWSTLPRDYEIGVDRGVLYPDDEPAVSWNGLSAVKEASDYSGTQFRYIDGVRVRISPPKEEFIGSIVAYTYPSAFEKYDGISDHRIHQQRRSTFGLSYRVQTDKGYKIHIVYNVLVLPTTRQYEQKDTSAFSWDFTTVPIPIPGFGPSSHLIVDTNIAHDTAVADLEAVLYGDDTQVARLPSPDEVYDIVENRAILRVTDNGDGSFTVDGPDSAITMITSTSFSITWPSAIYIDSETYKISSL